MADVPFDRVQAAKRYASMYRETDPQIQLILHLPGNAPEREIRLLVVRGLSGFDDTDVGSLESIDFGMGAGSESKHKLVVLNVTPSRWEALYQSERHLPRGWTLRDAEVLECTPDDDDDLVGEF